MNLDRAIKRCKVHEGLRLQMYQCAADKPGVAGRFTIGYGYLIPRGQEELYSGGITVATAEQLFARMWNVARAEVDGMCRSDNIDLEGDEARYGVLVEMVYQHGGHAIRTGWPQFRAALARGDWKRAAREMRYRDGDPACPVPQPSVWWTQTTRRCDELAAIIETGKEEE